MVYESEGLANLVDGVVGLVAPGADALNLGGVIQEALGPRRYWTGDYMETVYYDAIISEKIETSLHCFRFGAKGRLHLNPGFFAFAGFGLTANAIEMKVSSTESLRNLTTGGIEGTYEFKKDESIWKCGHYAEAGINGTFGKDGKYFVSLTGRYYGGLNEVYITRLHEREYYVDFNGYSAEGSAGIRF
ncbi:MAG: hypothetical protein P9M03_04745, partial [Candidatus Theseobacter exili]|nr:hypothetical protein [Candidatus Theseobacter exili]